MKSTDTTRVVIPAISNAPPPISRKATGYASQPGKPTLSKNCAAPGSVKTSAFSKPCVMNMTPKLIRRINTAYFARS